MGLWGRRQPSQHAWVVVVRHQRVTNPVTTGRSLRAREWPRRKLRSVPRPGEAAELADEIRGFLLDGQDVEGPIDGLEQHLQRGRFRVRQARLLPEQGGA